MVSIPTIEGTPVRLFRKNILH